MKMREDITTALNAKQPEGIDRNGKPYKALIVDDSTTMRKIVAQYLRAEMYEICAEATNGEEAVEYYKENDPDIVTMDINMPVLDGIEALKRIIAYDKNARIVMLTTEGERETVLDAIRIGARGYVVKPPNKKAVCDKVKQALGD